MSFLPISAVQSAGISSTQPVALQHSILNESVDSVEDLGDRVTTAFAHLKLESDMTKSQMLAEATNGDTTDPLKILNIKASFDGHALQTSTVIAMANRLLAGLKQLSSGQG